MRIRSEVLAQSWQQAEKQTNNDDYTILLGGVNNVQFRLEISCHVTFDMFIFICPIGMPAVMN